MADFRKWLVAFAVVSILLGLGVTASAQITGGNNTMTCDNVTAVPRQVRGEGVTELVGDVIITCTGGSPTPTGEPVPLSNIHVQLSQPLTSRTFSGASEAMLMIDEPFPTSPFPSSTTQQVPGSAAPQIGCYAIGGQVTNNPYVSGTVGKCDIAGKNGGGGAAGNVYSNQYNTFQAVATSNLSTGAYTVDFNGVPIDPPGTNAYRVIRITNIRGDMTGLLSANNPPNGVAVTETVSVSTNQNISATTATLTVAYVFQGLQGGAVKSRSYIQCKNENGESGPSITFAEGFASSFKTRQATTTDKNSSNLLVSLRDDRITGGVDDSAEWGMQNIPGINYSTESGFMPGVDNPSALVGTTIGRADYGTRFLITINNLQNGVSLDFPMEPGGASAGPHLYLHAITGFNTDGTGGAWADADVTVKGTWTPTSGATTQYVLYEVVADDPNLLESVVINPLVSYTYDLGKNIPALGANSTPSTSTMTVSFAPLAADLPGRALPAGVPNTTAHASLPRFVNTQASPAPAVIISACSCNLLYPWVVQNDQFDTGLVVVNTGSDPWDASDAQDGVTTLYLYGSQSGSPVSNLMLPPASAAAINVPPGCALAVVMSTGGGVTPNCSAALPASNGSLSGAQTADFIGYVIAVSTYQYCHGVAYVSPRADPLHGSYYEAIQLDYPFALANGVTRTKQTGESQAH